MADIFISYSKQEPELTTALAKDLEACGYTTWWDTRILSGDEFPDIIHQELNQAKAVIVIWTPISVQSRWVRAEAHIGFEKGILIPLRSTDLNPMQLPFPHNTIHADQVDDRRKLFQALRRLGVFPPGGEEILGHFEYAILNDEHIASTNNGQNESQLARDENLALRQDIEDFIIAADNITSYLYPGDRAIPRFNILDINVTYHVFPNGDTTVNALFHINCVQDLAHFWRYWINADPESPEITTFGKLRFSAEDGDSGRKLDCLPMKNTAKHKVFAIFFPEMLPGDFRKISLSYTWPGFMNKLLAKRKAEFDWRYTSQNPDVATNIHKKWIFHPGFNKVDCRISGHNSPTSSLTYNRERHSQIWIYSDPSARGDDAMYAVEFSLHAG